MTALLATDLDGTLVRFRTVRPEDVHALMRWHEAGNLVVAATGRSVSLARLALADARRAAGADLAVDYVICASGTTILDTDGEVLLTNPLRPQDVRAMCELFMGRPDCALIATTLEKDYLLHNPWEGEQPAPGAGGAFHGFSKHFIPAGVEEVVASRVTSMPVRIPDDATADAMAARVVEVGAGALGAPRSTQYLDVVPAGQDKGQAIRFLIRHLAGLGTEVGLTASIGDSWNDEPMFAVTDRCCAMADGQEHTRAAALAHGGVVLPSIADFVGSLLG